MCGLLSVGRRVVHGLDVHRDQWHDGKAKAYVDSANPTLLVKNGIMLRKELPKHCQLWNYEGETKWYKDSCPKLFTGLTYVDGSCVPCQECPTLSRAGYGVVCVQEQLRNTQEDENEVPDDLNQLKYTCKNAPNPEHVCVEMCKEISGCNGECKKKLPDQKRIKANPFQALYASLPGVQQTTPRAELFAILKAVQYGVSPQVIVSDHKNHVDAIHDLARGKTHVLNPKTPHVDIWRNVVAAIQQRGGLYPDGLNQLWIKWQKAHVHATNGETAEQRNLCRGNDTADYFANEGRKLHEDVGNMITRVKYLYHTAKTWAKWIGKAASLQYDKDFDGCDHDLRDGKPPNQRKGRKARVDMSDFQKGW